MNNSNGKERPVRIAVGRDTARWHERFATALAAKRAGGVPVEFAVVSLEGNNWLDVVRPFDIVLWKPGYMGPKSAAQFMAKILFLQNHLEKLTVPNYATVWHFENKIAQSYIFSERKIKTPHTTASFDYYDAVDLIAREKFPLVFKEPHGAASRHVRLISSPRQAKRLLKGVFSHQLWMDTKGRSSAFLAAVLSSIFKPWFWRKMYRKLFEDEYAQAVYWQRFIPGNDADLRITVIGDRVAFGFWRHNRPHDFRASGSGRIDYTRPVPEQALRYCIGVSRELGFDSMAYDILLDGEDFLISEMSYGYLDTAIYNAPGYYELHDATGKMEFVAGHFWPQELWVDWALRRAGTTL